MLDATKASESLLIRPNRARQILGGVSPAFFWKTILPQLRSFRLGRARWIEVKSVHEFIARQIAGDPQEQARERRKLQDEAARVKQRRARKPGPPPSTEVAL
jgi:hypothetical protein